MLGLLVVAALAGLVLWVTARGRVLRWFGAGLCALSLLTLGWIIALLRADGPPDPLPEVQRITPVPVIA
ncbi:hypothetical protein [Jannaschia sp. CCS1]|uniref:hypothetical protein n=1 Tax=Jannaschia sp. (strain CCS1) TaxID=290400 RepID=UPI0002D25E36|nr:hypothetical protein [Jannaschia sp. CCS1]